MRMNIEDISYVFDVRVDGAPDSNVTQMADILRSGGKLPPIVINQHNKVVEGRQRFMASKDAGLHEIDVIQKTFNNENDERIFAIFAQLGSPAPLSPEDIRFNMRALLAGGMTAGEVITLFTPKLTYPLSKRYVDDAQSTISKAKIAKTVDDVLTGKLSPGEAMKRNGVTKKQFEEATVRRGKNITKCFSKKAKAHLGTSMRGISKKVVEQGKMVLREFNDGIVNERDALSVVEHAVDLTDSLKSRALDFRTRLVQAIELKKRSERS